MSTKQASLLIDEPPMLIYPTLAAALGIDRAVVLQQLHFLLNATKTAKSNYNLIDGKWWVYNSYPQWHGEHFIWLSERTIQRIFLELEGLGIVLMRERVKSKWDRRKWYTIDYAAWETWVQDWRVRWCQVGTIDGAKVAPSEVPDRHDDLTETSTKTTPETKKTPPPTAGGEPPPRPRDEVFDAVALHIFEQEAAEAEGGRIAKIANWLKGKYDGKGKERMGKISKPAEVAHIEKFAAYCKDEGFTPPLDFVKFVEQWRKWASKQRTAPTTAPALTLEEYDAMIAQEGNDAR